MLSIKCLAVIIAIIVFIIMLRAKIGFSAIIPIVIIFDFCMVVPLILEIFFGLPETAYIRFERALSDSTTTVYYCLFIIISEVAFAFELHRSSSKKNRSFHSELASLKNDLSSLENIHKKSIIYVAIMLLVLVMLICILASPNPGFFFRANLMNTQRPSGMAVSLLTSLNSVLAISILFLKLIDSKDGFLGAFTRILLAILMTLVDQKRTLLMIVVGGCIVIDLIKQRKKIKVIPKYVVIVLAVAVYFVYYSIASGKYFLNTDWYYISNEYFFRSMHTRFAIYAALHQNEIHVLDYPGQSMIFSLLYFIPSSIWHSKPLPYITYFTAAAIGANISTFANDFSVRMPMGYFPEFVSNFGIPGILISVIFTIWISRFLDRRKGMTKLIGVALITLLIIYYYDNALKIVAFVELILWINEKVIFTFRGKKIGFAKKMKLKRAIYKCRLTIENIQDLHFVKFNRQAKPGGIVLLSHESQKLGASLLLLHIAEEFVALGENVYIISMNCGELDQSYSEIAPYQICLSEYSLKKTLDILHRKYHYDRLIANTVVVGDYVKLAKKQGYRVVSLIHELANVIKQIGYINDAREMIELSDVTVFSTQVAKDEVLQLTKPGYESNNIVVKPQGVYYKKPSNDIIKLNKEAIVNKHPQIIGKKIIAGIGNTTYRKGFDIFLKVADTLPSYCFIWVGMKERHYDQIIKDRRGKLPDNFIYLGKMTSEELSGVYCLMDILFISARQDTLPSTIFESLLYNKPVVGAKDSGGIVDVINKDNGVLTENVNVEQFARAISNLLENGGDKILSKKISSSNTGMNAMKDYAQFLEELTLKHE